MKETLNGSPTQRYRHSIVIEEVCIFSNFLNTIRENLIIHEISQNVELDLQKIVAWFIIDYFVHNIDLIALSRKSFRPQNSEDETVLAVKQIIDETVLADETDYDWSLKKSTLKETNDIKEFYATKCLRLPKETIKQTAVRIETLVRKTYSLNTHDYTNTKITEILLMTLTPQLRKVAIKKRALHPSSFREPDIDFRKLVDKLERAGLTLELEETENLKSQYVNNHDSDTELAEKITQISNIYGKNPNFKSKPSSKKW